MLGLITKICLLVLVVSLGLIAFIKWTHEYHNVHYVVTDVYRSVHRGTSMVTTTYCKVKNNNDCFTEDVQRLDPKFNVGDRVQQYQQEFDPITNFFITLACTCAMVNVLLLISCFVAWITPVSHRDYTALKPKNLG